MTLSRRCARAIPVVFAVWLAALGMGCGRNVVEFPLDGGPSATVATQAGTVVAGTVPASNYSIDFETLSLVKDTDNVVQSESGYAQLEARDVIGQDYAIHLGSLSAASTLAEVEIAYSSAKTKGALSQLTTLRLPAEGFELVGERLDTGVERTVIIRNTDEGVSSYQLLLVSIY